MAIYIYIYLHILYTYNVLQGRERRLGAAEVKHKPGVDGDIYYIYLHIIYIYNVLQGREGGGAWERRRWNMNWG